MQSLKFTLSSFLASALVVCAVKNITVDDFDPRIVYSPTGWRHENSGATLERFNLTTSYTGAQSLASFKFNGTAVYFISYGIPDPEPAKYQVTVDGTAETRSLRVSGNPERAQFMAYSRTGLDESREHQIVISNPLGISLNIDAFIITVPDNSTMYDGFNGTQWIQPIQPTDSISTQPNGDSGLSAATKAGIAVAIIGGVLLGLLGVFGTRYWRRKKKSKAGVKILDLVERMERGNSTSQSPETRQSQIVFPFVRAVDDVQQTRPGNFRKERRLNGETYRAPETQGEMDEDVATTSGITSGPLPSSPSAMSAHPPPYTS